MTISGKAKVAGVIGWPVGHSLSPRLHDYWLRRYGIDGAFIPMPVSPNDLADVLRVLPKIGICGVNVTVPHKEAALALMDDLDPQARAIGAVNTVIVRADGSLEGRNTDAFGFLENLLHGAPNWHAVRKPATVVGAGGAARAVCVALLEAGVPQVYVVNRTFERAEEMGRELGERVIAVPWKSHAQAIERSALLVNATTLGMKGQPEIDLDLSRLPRETVVTDVVYTPLETPLLKFARARGNTTVDGLGMLIHQARPGFESWFGVAPEVTEELRAFLVEGLLA
ncbi:MAG: shikimate dehydrogenase [Alphaproteobacteria bacterium]